MAKRDIKETETIRLKNPLRTYQPRLTRFLKLMVRVRNLEPGNLHLWKIMDMVCFQDTETALKVTVLNHKAETQKHKNRLTG